MTYLYEPNASIMKAGCFTELEHVFGIEAISVNSHLYLSDRRLVDFPGRAFQVDQVLSLKDAVRLLKGKKANVSCRNFPMKPEELKRKIGVKDGGDWYVFATKISDERHIIIVAQKFQSV